jgi:hypothetical protein
MVSLVMVVVIILLVLGNICVQEEGILGIRKCIWQGDLEFISW